MVWLARCLLWAAVACQVAATTGVEAEPFPKDMLDEHVAVVIAVGGVTGAALLALAGAMVAGIKPRLAVLISMGIWLFVVVSAILTWTVTYIAFRDLVHDNAVEILNTVSTESESLKVDIEQGYSMLDMLARRVAHGNMLYNTRYPQTSVKTFIILTSVGLQSQMSSGLYYGLTNGRAFGTIGGDPVSGYTHVTGVQTLADVPDGFTCFPKYDYAATPCDAALCGVDPAVDQQDCPATCAQLDPAAWVPAARYCVPSAGKTSTLIFLTLPSMLNETFQLRGSSLNMTPSGYDPRARPWYVHNMRGFMWAEPYLFNGGAQTGISLTAGLWDSTGTFVGVAAMDYTLTTMQRVLMTLPPTTNSVIFIISNNWLMLSSSMTPELIAHDTGLPASTNLVNVTKVTNPDSLIGLGTQSAGADGLQAAIEGNTRIMHNRRHAVLCHPLRVIGGLDMLVVGVTPHDDLMEEADDASTRALVVAVLVSVTFGLFGFLLASLALQPVRGLAMQMDLVAWMKLENVQCDVYTFTSEVCWMNTSFALMVQNLVEFRQYLPQSMLADAEGAMPDAVEQKDVTVVFTDIQNSTAAWEKKPATMRVAVRVHHNCIRKCIETHNGQEIRTIGDAFMVAFEKVDDAVAFSLNVQEALLAAPWPEDLYTIEDCAKVGDVWAGLRVRIGVHAGRSDCEKLTATRYDYHGTDVTIALRLEGCGIAGAVAVSEETLKKMDQERLARCTIQVEMGEVSLRGLSTKAKITLLLPTSLQARKAEVAAKVPAKLAELHKIVEKEPSMNSSRQQSEVSWRTDGEALAKGAKDRFQEKLLRTACSSVVNVQVKFRDGLLTMEPEESMSLVSENLSVILHVATKCLGTVLSVVGGSLVIGWNTSHNLSTHCEAAFRFVNRVHTGCEKAFGVDVFMGASCGPMLTGNVGRNGQRFVTAFGSCTVLARLLADSAPELGVSALFAMCPGASEPRGLMGMERYLRPVDTWSFEGDTVHGPVVVMEVDAAEIPDTEFLFEELGTTPPWGWSKEYRAAYHARDFQLIREKAGMSACLVQVAAMLEQSLHLREPLHELALS